MAPPPHVTGRYAPPSIHRRARPVTSAGHREPAPPGPAPPVSPGTRAADRDAPARDSPGKGPPEPAGTRRVPSGSQRRTAAAVGRRATRRALSGTSSAPGRKDQFSHSPAAPLHPRSDPRHRRWSWRGDFARVTISAAPPCPKTFTGRGVEHRNHWFVPVGPRPCRVRHRFPLVSHVPSAPGAPGAAAACAHGPGKPGRRAAPARGAGRECPGRCPHTKKEGAGAAGRTAPCPPPPPADGALASGAVRSSRRSSRPAGLPGGGEPMRTAPEAGRRSFTYRRQTPRKGPQICQGCASLR